MRNSCIRFYTKLKRCTKDRSPLGFGSSFRPSIQPALPLVAGRVVLLADDRQGTADSVERLTGTKAEARFAFITDKAEFANEDLLDV
jgi:hypothetical protein